MRNVFRRACLGALLVLALAAVLHPSMAWAQDPSGAATGTLKDVVVKDAQQAGLRFIRQEPFLPYQYFLIFGK